MKGINWKTNSSSRVSVPSAGHAGSGSWPSQGVLHQPEHGKDQAVKPWPKVAPWTPVWTDRALAQLCPPGQHSHFPLAFRNSLKSPFSSHRVQSHLFLPSSSCYKLTQLRSLWIFLGPVDPFSPHLASNSLPWTHTGNVAPGSLCQEQPISLE